VGRQFVGYHEGEVMDFGAALLILLAECGELGVNNI